MAEEKSRWPALLSALSDNHYIFVEHADVQPTMAQLLTERLVKNPVPSFLRSDLDPKSPNEMNTALKAFPGLKCAISEFLLTPNPKYYDFEQFPNEPGLAKQDPRGFALLAWWVPPGLRAKSAYFSSTLDFEPQAKDITSWPLALSELRKCHVGPLKELQRGVNSHLRDVYKLTDAEIQAVGMFVHYPYIPPYSLIHVHIRINLPEHPVLALRTHSLDTVIKQLEQHGEYPFALRRVWAAEAGWGRLLLKYQKRGLCSVHGPLDIVSATSLLPTLKERTTCDETCPCRQRLGGAPIPPE